MGVKGWALLLATAIATSVYAFVLSSEGSSPLAIFTPGMVILINHLFYKRKESLQQFSFQLLLLCLFSMVFVHELISSHQQKELENRAIYAKKLATERDVNLEIEFLESKEALIKDPVFLPFSDTAQNKLLPSTIASILEKRYFHGIWDIPFTS